MAAPIIAVKAGKEVILHPKKTAKTIVTIIIAIFLIIFVPIAAIIDTLSSKFFFKNSTATIIEDTEKYNEIVNVYKTYRETVWDKLEQDSENVPETDCKSLLIIAPDIHYSLAYYTVNAFYNENYILKKNELLKFLLNVTSYSYSERTLENGQVLWEYSAKPLSENEIISIFTSNAEWKQTYITSLELLKKEVEQQDLKNISIGNMASALAMTKVGYPYSQNTTLRMTTHYDCSSLVYRIYRDIGINLPATAALQGKYIVDNKKEVSEKQLMPGDLIFYSYAKNGRYKNISHVAIYAGDGMMVEAADEIQGVIYTKFRKTNVNLYGRPY